MTAKPMDDQELYRCLQQRLNMLVSMDLAEDLPTYAYSSFPTIDPCHRRALVGEALKESFVGK